MVFKQNSIHRQFHGIHSIYYLPVVHRRCIILYIHTFMYVFTDKRETLTALHTLSHTNRSQIMSMCSQHIMENQFLCGIALMTCLLRSKKCLITSKCSFIVIIIITLSSRCWCRAPVSPGCPAKSLLLVWSKAMDLHGVWGDRKKEKLQLKVLCKTRSMDFLWRRYPSPSLTTHLQSLHTRHEFKHEEKTKIFTSIAATNHQNFKIN